MPLTSNIRNGPIWSPLSSSKSTYTAGFLALVLFVLLGVTNGSGMNPADMAALDILSQRWPALLTLPTAPWNLSTDCLSVPFHGLKCLNTSQGASIWRLAIDSQFGPENVSVSLDSLVLPNFISLVFSGYNLSLYAQSSLYVSTLEILNIDNSPIIQLGDVSNLTSLSAFVISRSPNLVSLPSFANSTSITAFALADAYSLTYIAQPWLNPSGAVALSISNVPLLTTLPAVRLSTLYISNCSGLVSLPTPPASCEMSVLTLYTLPNLANFNFSSCPLQQVIIQSCPLLTAFSLNGNINGALISQVYLSYFAGSALPDFVCQSSMPLTLSVTYSNLASVSSCLCNLNLLQLSLANAGSALTWLPQCIFALPMLRSLDLGFIPSLVINQTLQQTIWNLPSLMNLNLPPSFLIGGIPAQGSLIGAGSAPSVSFPGPPVSGSIPDNYFTVFANVSSLVAATLNLSGSLPSSMASLTKMNVMSLFNNSFTGSLHQDVLLLPKLLYLDLSGNNLSGALPNLTGALPSSATIPKAVLQLESNSFDLCSISVSFDFVGLSVCEISGYCDTCTPLWSGCTPICITGPAPNPIPQIAPSAAPASSPAAPPAVPSLCGGYPPPSVGSWICLPSDQWFSNTSVVAPTSIQINSAVLVQGQLTAPFIIFSNRSASASVSGCVFSTSSVQIVLNQYDIQQLLTSSISSDLILLDLSSNASCPSISSIPVSLTLPSDTCQRISATTPANTVPSMLLVHISVDSSGCNGSPDMSWIVIVGVVGGILLLGIIGTILIFVMRRRKSNRESQQNEEVSNPLVSM